MTSTKVHQLHAGIAERGKLYALKGEHRQALACYRQALQMAQSVRAPQIFARHYLHCVLESLEHLGAYTQAAALAQEAANAVPHQEHASDFQRRDQAHLLERQGVNILKDGRVEEARKILKAALEIDSTLALARQLLDWTSRGLALSPARIMQAQRGSGYFTVRADTVNPARAVEPAQLTSTSLPEGYRHG